MSYCKNLNLNFSRGGYLNNSCSITSSPNSDYTTSSYINLSSFEFDVLSNSSTFQIFVCEYDLNHKMISRYQYPINSYSVGSHEITLEPNLVYRVSYPYNYVRNFTGKQCNVGIGSMANELAFGKLTFLDEIGTIIPFVIPLIAFALGFLLLKKMIKRGNQGHA